MASCAWWVPFTPFDLFELRAAMPLPALLSNCPKERSGPPAPRWEIACSSNSRRWCVPGRGWRALALLSLLSFLGPSAWAEPPAGKGDGELLDEPAAVAPTGEAQEALAPDVAASDRVKSVQRKRFIKKGRFELTPMGFVSVNDAFFPKYGPAMRLAWYFEESLALALRYNQFNLIPSQNLRLARRQLQSRLEVTQPNDALSLELLWSPLPGKVAIFDSIIHFELYALGGAGIASIGNGFGRSTAYSMSLGVGQRFFPADFLAVDFALVETLLASRGGLSERARLDHGLMVQGGVSLFFPFSFNFREQ